MGKPVSFGRQSEIYELGNNRVLKLYDLDFPKQKVIDEFGKTLTVYNSNKIKVPKPIELIEKDNRTGIVFEKINGIALMDLFQRKSWLYFSYQHRISDIHGQIHGVQIKDLPTQSKEFERTITNSNKLSKEEKDDLLGILKQEYDPVLCHGDFHHGNIILDEAGDYYVIDWMDAFSGDYRLDVALTAVNAMVSDAPSHVPAVYKYAYEFLKRILKLDKRYLKLYGLKEKEIRDFLFLAAGIHLAQCNQKDDSLHREYFEKKKLCLTTVSFVSF